jgi:hypothetical protein
MYGELGLQVALICQMHENISYRNPIQRENNMLSLQVLHESIPSDIQTDG